MSARLTGVAACAQGRSSRRGGTPRAATRHDGPVPEPLGRATMKDGTLTTQTFSGDETQEPATSAGSVTALPDRGETLAVPFRDFGISEAICSGLEAAGIFTTFPIQALTLPLALTGQDIIGQARTGTGKTLAFGIPLLQRLDDQPPRTGLWWWCRPGSLPSRCPMTWPRPAGSAGRG